MAPAPASLSACRARSTGGHAGGIPVPPHCLQKTGCQAHTPAVSAAQHFCITTQHQTTRSSSPAPEVRVVDVAVDAEEALKDVAHRAAKGGGKGATVALREHRRVVQLQGGPKNRHE